MTLLYVVHIVSKFMQALRHLNLFVVHCIIHYIFDTPGHNLFFPAGSSLQLQAYSDADWAGSLDTREFTIG